MKNVQICTTMEAAYIAVW